MKRLELAEVKRKKKIARQTRSIVRNRKNTAKPRLVKEKFDLKVPEIFEYKDDSAEDMCKRAQSLEEIEKAYSNFMKQTKQAEYNGFLNASIKKEV